MKVLNVIFKVALCLLLLSPVAGALHIGPPPTEALYNTPQAFAFISMLYATGYILYIMAIVSVTSIILIIMNRMALALLLILPIVVNIVSFHLFLDGGLFTKGAILADIFALLTIYFLWQNRNRYTSLWNKN